ncbi:MAG TPA: oligosaccharide flippase family protein, partial [Patescibacteria group bacterium]
MIQHTPIDTTDEVEELLTDEVEIASIKQRSVTGALSYFFRTALLQVIGLASVLVLSAFFRPEDFGIYGFVIQIIGLLIFFSDIGLAAALVQKKQEPNQGEYRVTFTLQWLLSWLIVLAIGLILSTGWIQQKTGSAGAWVLLSLGVSFPLATLKTIPSIRLERKLLFNKLIIPQIFEQLVFHAILIALAWRGMGVLAYAYAVIARSIIGVIVMWLIEPWPGIGLWWNTKVLKSLLSFGVKFQLNDFLARIKDQLFFLGLGAFLPLDQFGYIQWAKNWSQYPYNLTVQNVLAITFPTYSRLQSRPDLLKKAIEKSLFFISLAIFPILTMMSVFIWPLTQVVERYRQWEPAVLSFILFTLSIGWAALSTPLVNTLNAIGKINKTLKLMTLWTGLTWVITPLLLWKMGYNGVAWAALIISFTSVLSIRMVKKYVPIVIISQVKLALLGSIGMAIFGLWGQSL